MNSSGLPYPVANPDALGTNLESGYRHRPDRVKRKRRPARYAARMKDRATTRHSLKSKDRRRIAERCERRGLGTRGFARRHRIAVSSLTRWLPEARNDRKEIALGFFREVTVSPSLSPAPSSGRAVEIVGPIRAPDAPGGVEAFGCSSWVLWVVCWYAQQDSNLRPSA